ncbi:PhoH family protein [Desulfonatronospira thiodismutans ASO3-1]|uniref:PhoH-like protein n=1 Tax=Desulfonatronospira thiodismutans ASO3-1 TaxID=555779 RepID=D6SS70_9BACT|nr:PhoH family protein [Desulfonatronospira thiodismutans]EFI33536.1 PhoH family protein [Desulfonatronospira thiodismutans ASO3-1]
MPENNTDQLQFSNSAYVQELCGPQGRNLETIHQQTGVQIESRGGSMTLTAKDQGDLELARSSLLQLYALIESGYKVYPEDVEAALRILRQDIKADLKKIFKKEVFVVSSKKTIAPRSSTQRAYLQAIKEKDLVFGIGPAGTGKTYLAVAVAISYLMQRVVKRIILARPAVEAGEKLGFLPGDMLEKVNPYLRPLYDALHDMLEFNKVQELLESGMIEVAPLAFMRGRTLNESFIILDEAQNTTPEQMKMFLTRMGLGSKAVITGDITQVDLPGAAVSGLIQSRDVLKGEEGIKFIYFNEHDVIRHSLVARIIKAYERFDQARLEKKEEGRKSEHDE